MEFPSERIGCFGFSVRQADKYWNLSDSIQQESVLSRTNFTKDYLDFQEFPEKVNLHLDKQETGVISRRPSPY